MNATKIEYLTHTWNPIVMRCTPTSTGCANCWHLRTADRMARNPKISPELREAYAGKRPANVDWLRGIRDQCTRAGVPFLFKQWGGPNHRGWIMDGKLFAGRKLEGREWNEYPEVNR